MKIRNFLICITWFGILAGATATKAQPIDIQVWHKQLSEKEDTFQHHVQEIHAILYHADSSHRCAAYKSLEELAAEGNTRLKIRVALLLGLQAHHCPSQTAKLEVLRNALDLAFEIEDAELIATTHQTLSNEYFNQGEAGFSLMHAILCLEEMKRAGTHRFNNVSAVLYGMADRYYKTRDYRNAANANLEAIRYRGPTQVTSGDTLSAYWKMNAWNNLGLCYERLVLYDSALIAFNNALQLTQDSFWRGLIQGNQGDVYFLQGRYAEAAPLLQIDYEQSLKAGEIYNANITLQRLARIANAKGEHTKALSMLHEAAVLNRQSSHIDYRASLYESYALVYRELNLADSVYHYLAKYNSTQDTIEAHAAENKLSLAQLRLSNQDQVNEIDDLRKDKKRIQLIRNFSIALILLLAAFGYVYVNRMRLQARLKQQEALEGKRIAEAEAAHAHAQLNIFTESLREKTKMLEEMQVHATAQQHTREQIEQLEELSNSSILTDSDWDRFRHLFVKVYPGFFIELKKQVPDITVAEQRMAALIKLRIPNKDAASMLGISPNSIHKTKQRLRQRMGFTDDVELNRFFNIVEEKPG